MNQDQRNERSILLTRSEIRELLAHGAAEIRRPVRPGPLALQVAWRSGDVFWVREAFATRSEGSNIVIRYAVDGGPSDAKAFASTPRFSAFATKTHRAWEAKYMPREFARLVVEIVSVREESGADRREVVLPLRVLPERRATDSTDATDQPAARAGAQP